MLLCGFVASLPMMASNSPKPEASKFVSTARSAQWKSLLVGTSYELEIYRAEWLQSQ